MDRKIRQLVLDAGPLITQSASSLQQFAQEFYTTPGVFGELKDEQARNQLILWNDNLKIKQPSSESIKKVENFARLTGDFAVLSTNDIHIIALAYELEVEANSDWKIRKFPGENIDQKKKPESVKKQEKEEIKDTTGEKKKRRRGGKKQREKREAQLQKELDELTDDLENLDIPKEEAKDENKEEVQEEVQEEAQEEVQEDKGDKEEIKELSEEFQEEDDDGEWITPENLIEEMTKDNNEEVKETNKVPLIKVAFSTGDFACQNVSMQMGLNLMNSMSGKQIKRIRNYMYRCHACFKMTPIPKNGKPKHFCPKCGGNTLLRCAVSIDNNTGKVTPHLKSNFQWIKRGNVYSMASPLSKNQQKRQGNGGYQHNKENRHKTLQMPELYSEDQKEYQKAVKDDDWQRRKNDKLLQEWIGGGSADNFISPFNSIQTLRPSGVRVGKGRFANSSRGKRK
ncbi:20S-pre-rRNA D-site endonuclease Nob1p [[Candida] jaroonii]|uniref:20S-pre-rRNA D-site endonuclease Nob1p n=1 Tax=[Candida] jaroonii TaxID=467808 RepID=A0ACA9Y1H3_9ASCO|nr:20S-pre-rRNA D-site endonuclease Nob1p [[Candida] jaroonii]